MALGARSSPAHPKPVTEPAHSGVAAAFLPASRFWWESWDQSSGSRVRCLIRHRLYEVLWLWFFTGLFHCRCRSYILICPPAYGYCSDGVRRNCAAGHFGGLLIHGLKKSTLTSLSTGCPGVVAVIQLMSFDERKRASLWPSVHRMGSSSVTTAVFPV